MLHLLLFGYLDHNDHDYNFDNQIYNFNHGTLPDELGSKKKKEKALVLRFLE
jgi:hypothetical protein